MHRKDSPEKMLSAPTDVLNLIEPAGFSVVPPGLDPRRRFYPALKSWAILKTSLRDASNSWRPMLLVFVAMTLSSAAITFPGESGQATNSTSVAGPRIRFDAETNAFGEVMAGQPLKHIFSFTNLGNQDLVISKVQPGCGCTSAGDWSRRTKPGETGLIPIQLHTGGLSGSVEKIVTVTCNDSTQPVVTLKLRGRVRKAVDIQPSLAILNPQPDSPFCAAVIRITNCLSQPLLLWSPESTNHSLSVELKTNVLGQDYLLSISNNIPLQPGALVSTITLQTSVATLPVIRLVTMAVVSQTFTVEPSQISLAPALLSTNQVAYITILNNSTNPVSLSDPQVPAGGVGVSIKETKPGAAFTATLKFPAGFQLPSGQTNYFSLRTSHPLCPLVQVPILQVSNAVPAPPVLSSTGTKVATAALPMVYQTDVLDALKLGEEQLQEIDGLKKQFLKEIGGLSQDPNDPAYLARWRKARPKVDSMLTAVIGQRALVRFDTSGDSPGVSQ